ncbi:hypothetical protein BC936DRAFT_147404 [Jimgerdemannia flammicorona]|uniref:Uncharacterized protein n=2 Tax=Jimgerdemannia flammicorona TaxID=994334 RepID=A0A433D5D7_9FUNG|nr:hypothetical protein BC936DRAFT_147404 [Jimgerdemannia flammicorona]RUS27901.1 hypothetical protein BC938DRAFT_482591 [Jimgerdemannia flammicorona]
MEPERELEQQYQERHANVMNNLEHVQENIKSGFETAQEKLKAGVEVVKQTIYPEQQQQSTTTNASTTNAPITNAPTTNAPLNDTLRTKPTAAVARDQICMRGATAEGFAGVGSRIDDSFAGDVLAGEGNTVLGKRL